MDRRKIYYVYEWYNIETGYIFYVGKGCKDRIYQKNKQSRNKYFINYINKYKCDKRKIFENLTEKQAFKLEHERIVFLRKTNQCCCNLDDGGINGGRNFGEKNGFYGKKHSSETIEIIRQKNIGIHSGEKNPQYGISLKERMSKKVYSGWIKKHKQNMIGSKNPQYGKTVRQRMKTQDKYREFCKSCARGNKSDNPNSKAVCMYNEFNIYNFNSIIECAEYLINEKYSTAKKIMSVQSNISLAIKNDSKYLNFKFKFLKKR